MGTRDPRVDAYIARSAEFARPILTHLRETVHRACPDCEETLKWGHPSFTYKGLMCGMASFKQHCTFGFWKGSLVLGRSRDGDAMGQFGRIARAGDLPSKSALSAIEITINRKGRRERKGVRATGGRRSRPATAQPRPPENANTENRDRLRFLAV